MDTELTLTVERSEPAERPSDFSQRPCTAESAECTCPDFCERDHDND